MGKEFNDEVQEETKLNNSEVHSNSDKITVDSHKPGQVNDANDKQYCIEESLNETIRTFADINKDLYPEQNTRKSYFKKVVIASIAVVIVLLTAVFIVTKYSTARTAYNDGIASLKKQHWESAKNSFEKARKNGIFFFQGGLKIYQKSINDYGKEKLELAEKAFENGDYAGSSNYLLNVPKDVEQYKDVEELNKKNPYNIQAEGMIDPSIVTVSKEIIFLAPEVPGVIVKGRNDKFMYLYIIGWDNADNQFKVMYTNKYDGLGNYNEYITKIIPQAFGDGRTAIAVSYISSAGVSSYSTGIELLGYFMESRHIVKYVNLPFVDEGSIEATDKNLIVKQNGNSNINIRYSWNGEKFIEEKVFVQPAVGVNDIVVHYSIGDKNMTLEVDQVDLHIGQKLVLIRDDKTSITERILYSANGTIEHIAGQDGTFRAVQAGTTDITIIPHEYDWEKSKVLLVNVVD